MNAKQIFQQAHRLTKEVLKYNDADYHATFSSSLKVIYAGIKKEQASILNEAKRQKNKAPHIFTKSIEEMTESRLNSKYLAGTVVHKIISNMPSVKAKLKENQEKAYNYYKSTGGRITMC